MLSFATPPLQVGTVLLYPDHKNPLMYYYSAGVPRIAAYENNALMYALFIYRDILEHSVFNGTTIPEEMGAGFLTMGVDCGRTEDELEDARDALADMLSVEPEKILLAPIPYKDGTVRLIGLDIKEASATPAPLVPAVTDNRPVFVRDVFGAARPALLGDLRSIFSLRLSDKGAAFMAGVHNSGALPFGVSYDLTFEGLRPAVEATITADTSQIRTYFGGGIEGQYQFFKADISAGIEKMHRDGKVRIEITSQQSGEAAERTKKLALDLFKERIIQDLFNPGLPAVPPQVAAAGSTASSLSSAANALSQTASGTGSITLSLKAEKEITTGALVYNFSESAPEERRDAANGFLQALLTQQQRDAAIIEVDLGQSAIFFNTLDIVISAPEKSVYETLRITQITVDIVYGEDTDDVPPDTKSLVFKPDGARDRTIAFSRSGRKSVAYGYRVQYDFADDANVTADALRYIVPMQHKTARTLSINPQDDFSVRTLTVRPGRIDDNISGVDARIVVAQDAGDDGASDENEMFTAEKIFRFTPPFSDVATSEATWTIRTRDKITVPYQVHLDYIFPNDEVYPMSPRSYSGSLLTLDDPFFSKRDLLIIPNVVSDTISAIDVEIEYTDDTSLYARHFLTTLRTPFAPLPLSWPIINPALRTIVYRTTVHENGLSETTEDQISDEPSITVGSSLVLVDKISVRLIGGSLTEAQIDAVVVDVKTRDEEDREKTTSLFFAEGEDLVQTVPLIRRPDDAPIFSYRIQAFKADGTQTTSDWVEKIGNPLLIISIRNL